MPDETYAPLIVDADRVLSLPVGLQGFEPVAGRDAQVAEHSGLIQETKLSQGNALKSDGNFRLCRPDQINSVSASAKL